ncbi:MAG TPA: F0F1 ATP synthase subunit gamma [Dongiaceae bacterium]|nr:F0F1 ATP synthase subunit gamma [Dongiaceae bacterium]
MPSLKDLKIRINSVKSTQKITSAMKMVAAAKLRRAQERAEAARPYAERMERMLGSLAGSMAGREGAPPLLAGNGRDHVHLIVVMTSDRGLCGGFNSSIVRAARRKIQDLRQQGNEVKIFAVGRKGRDQLRRDLGGLIIGHLEDVGKPRLSFAVAARLGERLATSFAAGEFDVCHIVYNKFKSAMTQIVTFQQLIPFALPASGTAPASDVVYDYEPDETEILEALLPRNLGVQLYRALLENGASEEGARMTAMDSATRNAGDMINKLTIFYNRSRQAYITKELIEIISGAEAL